MYTNLDSIWPDHFTMLDTEDFKKQQVHVRGSAGIYEIVGK
jgi:hypothetical protein